jgi:transposase
MTDIFQRAGELLDPVYKVMLAKVPEAEVVHADETPFRQQDKEGRVYFWTFATRENTVYSYAGTRSGKVAHKVLGDSKGTLVVDGYTGYTRVTGVNGRERAGCYAHARRKFHETLAHPEAKRAYDLIGQLYVIEADARKRGIVGTSEHAEMRRVQSAPIVDTLFVEARACHAAHDPKSDIARAMAYIVESESTFRVFLGNAAVPIDNNVSEQKIRRIALGRGNFLFAGSANGGKALATLYSLVATCEQHRINPQAYLEAAFSETITTDNAAEWLPKVWYDRVTALSESARPPPAAVDTPDQASAT